MMKMILRAIVDTMIDIIACLALLSLFALGIVGTVTANDFSPRAIYLAVAIGSMAALFYTLVYKEIEVFYDDEDEEEDYEE